MGNVMKERYERLSDDLWSQLLSHATQWQVIENVLKPQQVLRSVLLYVAE